MCQGNMVNYELCCVDRSKLAMNRKMKGMPLIIQFNAINGYQM